MPSHSCLISAAAPDTHSSTLRTHTHIQHIQHSNLHNTRSSTLRTHTHLQKHTHTHTHTHTQTHTHTHTHTQTHTHTHACHCAIQLNPPHVLTRFLPGEACVCEACVSEACVFACCSVESNTWVKPQGVEG